MKISIFVIKQFNRILNFKLQKQKQMSTAIVIAVAQLKIIDYNKL